MFSEKFRGEIAQCSRARSLCLELKSHFFFFLSQIFRRQQLEHDFFLFLTRHYTHREDGSAENKKEKFHFTGKSFGLLSRTRSTFVMQRRLLARVQTIENCEMSEWLRAKTDLITLFFPVCCVSALSQNRYENRITFFLSPSKRKTETVQSDVRRRAHVCWRAKDYKNGWNNIYTISPTAASRSLESVFSVLRARERGNLSHTAHKLRSTRERWVRKCLFMSQDVVQVLAGRIDNVKVDWTVRLERWTELGDFEGFWALRECTAAWTSRLIGWNYSQHLDRALWVVNYEEFWLFERWLEVSQVCSIVNFT